MSEEPTFDELAAAPRKVVTVEGAVTERSVDELIKAERYTANQEAAENGSPWGIRKALAKPRGNYA